MIVQLLHQQRETDADVRCWGFFLTVVFTKHMQNPFISRTQKLNKWFSLPAAPKLFWPVGSKTCPPSGFSPEFFSPLHVQVVARVNLLCLILGFAHICVSQLLQVVNCWIVSFRCHQWNAVKLDSFQSWTGPTIMSVCPSSPLLFLLANENAS